MDGPQRRQLRDRVYRHFGLLLLELLALPCMEKNTLLELCTVSGIEHLKRVLTRGRGAFVLAGHLGNWELGLAALAASGFDTYTIAKEIRGRAGAHAADRIRQAHGVKPIPRRRSLRKIARALRANGGIGFALDQNMTADEGVFVQFFGHPACTMPALAVLSQRYQAPVLPVQFYRDDDMRHHRVVFLPEVTWEETSSNLAANIRHNTQRYTAMLEQLIQEHPDQWLWVHRRWRTQPPHDPVGEPRVGPAALAP